VHFTLSIILNLEHCLKIKKNFPSFLWIKIRKRNLKLDLMMFRSLKRLKLWVWVLLMKEKKLQDQELWYLESDLIIIAHLIGAMINGVWFENNYTYFCFICFTKFNEFVHQNLNFVLLNLLNLLRERVKVKSAITKWF